MSVAALAPRPGWTVVDACAAPGNKTTQAAAYVGETGIVLACERDTRRFEILQVRSTAEVAAHARVLLR
jgi:putative methyltransferase